MTITPTILNISQIDSSGLAITITTPVDDVKGFQIEVDTNTLGYIPLSVRNKLEIDNGYMLFVGELDADELAGERNTSKVFLDGFIIGDLVQVRIRNIDTLDVESDWVESDIFEISEQTIANAPMPVSSTNFNFFENDFNLYDSIQNEIIKTRGIDVIYLPKQFQKVDLLLGEDVLSKFDQSWNMKMYLANFSEFGGDGSMFGHFGLQVADQATFEVNINEFNEVSSSHTPVEGDIIYVPMGKWIMEIFAAKKHDPFFFLGKVSKYIIETRKYEYSSEEMNTGIEDVDVLNTLQSTDIDSENDLLNDEIDDILNSAEPNIFGDK